MWEIIFKIFIFAISNEPTFEFLLEYIIAAFIFATPYPVREIAKIRTQRKFPAIRYVMAHRCAGRLKNSDL